MTLAVDSDNEYYEKIKYLNEIKEAYLNISKKRETLVNMSIENLNLLYNNYNKFHIKLFITNIVFILDIIITSNIEDDIIRFTIYLIVYSTIIYAIVQNFFEIYEFTQKYKIDEKEQFDKIFLEIKDEEIKFNKLYEKI